MAEKSSRRIHHPLSILGSVALTLLSVTSTACVSTGEGQRLQYAIERNRQAIKEEQAQRNEALAQSAGVTQAVTRSSADLGAEVEALQKEVGELRGMIEEQQQALRLSTKQLEQAIATLHAQLRQQARSDAPAKLRAKDVPSDRIEHFQAARHAHFTANYAKAEALFALFLKRYPKDKRADEARYTLGHSQLRLNQPAKALGNYQRFIQRHAKSSLIDETLIDMADAFYRLKSCDDAKSTLKTVMRMHAGTQAAKQAKERLQRMEQGPANYCS